MNWRALLAVGVVGVLVALGVAAWQSGALAPGPAEAQPATKPKRPPGAPPEPPALPADLPQVAPRATIPGAGFLHYSCRPLVSADGKTLAVTGAALGNPTGAVARLYDLGTSPPKLLREFPGTARALSPSGRRLVVWGSVVEREGDRVIRLPRALDTAATPIQFLDDDRILSFAGSWPPAPGGYETKRAVVWDVVADRDAGSFDLPGLDCAEARLARGGRELWLYGARDPGAIRCVGVAGGAPLRTLRLVPPARQNLVGDLPRTTTPDGSRVLAAAAVGFDLIGTYAFYDGDTGRVVAVLPENLHHASATLLGRTRYLALAASGIAAPTGYDRSTWFLGEWQDGRVIAALSGGPGGAGGQLAAGSADGRVVVTQSAGDHAARVYDLPGEH